MNDVHKVDFKNKHLHKNLDFWQLKPLLAHVKMFIDTGTSAK
jgi:hypothetical protein